jgi:hypothetical protein
MFPVISPRIGTPPVPATALMPSEVPPVPPVDVMPCMDVPVAAMFMPWPLVVVIFSPSPEVPPPTSSKRQSPRRCS